MADLSWHMNRIRDGTRGGRAEFKWSDVKEMNMGDRECYLGGSTKMGIMGKFGKFVKTDWYNQERGEVTAIDEEREAVQKFEEELMEEALGLRPKKHMLAKSKMTPEQMKEYFKEQKKLTKEERVKEEQEEDPKEKKGLGFAPHRTAELEEKKFKVLGETGELEGKNINIAPGDDGAAASSGPKRVKKQLNSDGEEVSSSSSSSDSEKEKKTADTVKKEPGEMGQCAIADEKEEKRKLKKAAKKEKKEANKKNNGSTKYHEMCAPSISVCKAAPPTIVATFSID